MEAARRSRPLKALLVAIVVAVPTTHVYAETFDFTFEQFRAALDQKIRDDIADKSRPDFSTTRTCKKIKTTYTCTFNDAGFQSAVAILKKLDLMNGRFTLRLGLTVETEGGRVSAIKLIGSRADPVNLLQWNGTVLNVVQTFDPKATEREGSSLALSNELGLMRGDAAPNIGEPVVTIKPYALIRCLSVPSEVTMGVGCIFEPRS